MVAGTPSKSTAAAPLLALAAKEPLAAGAPVGPALVRFPDRAIDQAKISDGSVLCALRGSSCTRSPAAPPRCHGRSRSQHGLHARGSSSRHRTTPRTTATRGDTMAPKWPQRRLQIATNEKHADREGARLQALQAPIRQGPTASHARGRRFATRRAHKKCLQIDGFVHGQMHRSARWQCARLCARTLRAQTSALMTASSGGRLRGWGRSHDARVSSDARGHIESRAGRAPVALRLIRLQRSTRSRSSGLTTARPQAITTSSERTTIWQGHAPVRDVRKHHQTRWSSTLATTPVTRSAAPAEGRGPQANACGDRASAG